MAALTTQSQLTAAMDCLEKYNQKKILGNQPLNINENYFTSRA